MNNKLMAIVNIFLTLWLLVFRAADHDSETILFLQLVVPELDHLFQGFSHLSCVTEYQNWEETTPEISIFKALEKLLLHRHIAFCDSKNSKTALISAKTDLFSHISYPSETSLGWK